LRILLDAHAVVWALYDKQRLTPAAEALLEDRNNLLLVSHATLWELLAKVGRGKLPVSGGSVEAVVQDIHNLGVAVLPVTEYHIVAAATLPHHHSDPFDRILIAQAMQEDAPILSADRILPSYGVSVIWN
jgi:PIN domain nuclease of toxin-antitoxin system